MPSRHASRAAATHGASAAPTTWNASVATPPQHWPSRAASGKRTSHEGTASGPDSASASRAIRIASNSRWPPPIVPTMPSAVTTIAVPASRGTDPRAAATATSTATRAVPGARPSAAASASGQGRSIVVIVARASRVCRRARRRAQFRRARG